jgi:hypothetical protein
MKSGSESPLLGEAQATVVVGDELEAPKANSLTEGSTTCQTITISGDGEHR